MSRTIAAVAVAVCALGAQARAAEVFVTVSTTSATYSPAVVFIQPGDTVTWTYAGGPMPHNVVADDGSYFNQLSTNPWTFSHTFPVATTSRYYCSAHGGPGGAGMSGIVVVGGRDSWSPSDVAYTLNAWDFSPRLSTTATGSAASPDLHRTASGTELIAGVRLPSGAQITGLELASCNQGAPGTGSATLLQCLDPDGACTTLAVVIPPATPPCGYTSAPVQGVNVDNFTYSYIVRVPLGGQSLRSVRVFYRRVVSPAPATATFGDVPTSHPQFRFVEALVRAGITGGCATGQYCPDAPLTRGQMAVFLSVALGLYWPN